MGYIRLIAKLLSQTPIIETPPLRVKGRTKRFIGDPGQRLVIEDAAAAAETNLTSASRSYHTKCPLRTNKNVLNGHFRERQAFQLRYDCLA